MLDLVLPDEFVVLAGPAPEGLDRRLGDRGEHRIVVFWYEPKAKVAGWQDCTGHGFGAAGVDAWHAEVLRILACARSPGVGAGCRAGEVLLLDHGRGRAARAPRPGAEALLQSAVGGWGRVAV